MNGWSSELDRQDGLKFEAYQRRTTMTDALKTSPGPNRWDEITKDDFAKDFDYVINRQGSITVIDCLSEAALQWCYRHLPEDCPRWGARGFAIEWRFAADIIKGMGQEHELADGSKQRLISDEEYEFNMAAEERDRMAGEDDR